MNEIKENSTNITKNNDKNIIESNYNTDTTEILITKFSEEIFNEFGIEKERAIFLIKSSLEDLRGELISQNKNLGEKKIEELVIKIQEYKEILKKSSQNEIQELKQEVTLDNKEYNNSGNFRGLLEGKLPRKLVKIAKNPKEPHEYILSASLGVTNSIVSIGYTAIKIGIGIIKSPYDLYLIASGKAEIENLKNI